MNKQIIIGTGLNGLVGSKLKSDFSSSYDFESIDVSDTENPVDITNADQVISFISQSSAKYVVHFAAFTDVTKAWHEKDDKSGIVYKVNVDGTKNIIKACKDTQKHLIHVSTAYVFDGEKKDLYIENDTTNPIEWYGQTKAYAEEAIQASDIDWTILRIDQPFRSDTFPKQDILHRILSGIENDSLYPQFSNHYFGPTFIDDFTKVIDWVIRTGTTGLFNASSGEQFSDYDFAQLITKKLSTNYIVKEGNLDIYLKNLDRPYQRNTAMNCDKLKDQLDFEMTPISLAIQQSLTKI